MAKNTRFNLSDVILTFVLILAATSSWSCRNKNASGLSSVDSSSKFASQHVATDQAYTRDQYEAFGKSFVIATQGKAATNAAKKMFDLGGNAFDAAVAASFVISVERPQSTGLGGGGFLLAHHAKSKKVFAIDFRERAPFKAYEKMFQDEQGKVLSTKSVHGIHAVGVPGTVAGLTYIAEKYATLPLQTLIQPAIELAEKGFPVYPNLQSAIERKHKHFSDAAKAIFVSQDGAPLKNGDQLVQKDLAKTLRSIALKGKSGFYDGWVAHALINESKRLGGMMTMEDLNRYEVKYRKPVEGDYKGYRVVSMPPPSSGGTHIMQILNTLEHLEAKHASASNPFDADRIHKVVYSMQRAYADRASYMGDPDYVEVPVEKLRSESYTKSLASEFDPKKALDSSTIGQVQAINEGSNETTHFSIMDKEGNVIASTQTINYGFGSGLVVPGTGVVLNNEMDDFSAKPGAANLFGAIGGVPNAIEPGKRPLSSMSPTIVMDSNGKPFMALGSPNGTRIITCVVQTLLNVIDHSMPLWDAVSTQRYHHQWYPEEIRTEKPGFSAEATKALEDMGYVVKQNPYHCRIQAVKMESNNRLHAVSDIRGEGASFGE